MTLQKAIERIEMELRGAQATEKANREAGSSASTAFDAGRVAGLKEALEILAEVRQEVRR